jgi:hypothetical protein
MRIPSLVTAALLLGCLAALASDKHENKTGQNDKIITIDNGILSVSYDLENNTFSVRRGENTFIKQGRFPESTDYYTPTVQTIKEPHANLGYREAIEVKFTNRQTYILSLQENLPFLLVKTNIHNPTNNTIVINELTPLSFEVELIKEINRLRILGSDGLNWSADNVTSTTFLALVRLRRVNNAGVIAGWLTNNRATGIVSSKPLKSSVLVETRSEYGKLRLKPGKTAAGETFAIGYFDNAHAGLETYAEAIAKFNRIDLRPIPSGYCTWYHGYSPLDEKRMAQLADFCHKNLCKFGFGLLQIDDGWQDGPVGKGWPSGGPRGDFTTHRSDGPYPNGMKATADTINAAGMTAGIWFMPFAWDPARPIFKEHQDWFVKRATGELYKVYWAGTCLDMTHPQARDFLRSVVARITKQWGYKYIKIDGLWSGMATQFGFPRDGYRAYAMGDAIFHDSNKTNIEAYRDGLKTVREGAGDDVFILGCNISQNMRVMGASFGLVDGMRIGGDIDAKWEKILKSATAGSRFYFLHGRVWHNDPDCLVLREPLTLDQAKSWGSWIAISGQLNLVSEWLPELPKDRLEVVKRSMPNHGLCGRPIDLFQNTPPQIWHLTDERSGNRRDIIGIFNWDDKNPLESRVELETLNLPYDRKTVYIGFDYWNNKFVPPFTITLESELPPASCRVISMRPLVNHPQLIGTSRHITQGIIDVTREQWNADTNTLSGAGLVVSDDPYELRIAAPTETGFWPVDSATVSDADQKAGVTIEIKQSGPEVRITINSPESREVSWQVTFKKSS